MNDWRGRVEHEHMLPRLPRQRVQRSDALDLVAEKLDADGVLHVAGKTSTRLPAHAEGAALEGNIVALVQVLDEAFQERLRPSMPPTRIGIIISLKSSGEPSRRCRRRWPQQGRRAG
jgi:hypothetical protein